MQPIINHATPTIIGGAGFTLASIVPGDITGYAQAAIAAATVISQIIHLFKKPKLNDQAPKK